MHILAPLVLCLSAISAAKTIRVQLNGPSEGAVQKSVPANGKPFVLAKNPPTLDSYTSAFIVDDGGVKGASCRAYKDAKGKKPNGKKFTESKSSNLRGDVKSLSCK